MAGHTAPPARRVAFDRDNVQAVQWNNFKSTINVLTTTDLAKLNDEDDDNVLIDATGNSGQGDSYIAFIFPANFKCSHIKLGYGTSGAEEQTDPTLERSDDTTNGRDGAWTSEATLTDLVQEAARPNYREGIFSVGAATARKAWRIHFVRSTIIGDWEIRYLHLYGVEYGHVDRLAFWHPSSDLELTPDLDFGDKARGAAQSDLTFRIKNVSPTKQAQSVTLTLESGPSYPGMAAITTISSGGAFGSSCTLANINANTIGAETITLRFAAGGVPLGTELEALTMRVTPSATFV